MNRAKLFVLISVAAAFVAGISIGVVIGGFNKKLHLKSKLSRELNLTSEQRDQMKKIWSEGIRTARRLQREQKQKLQKERDESIEELLTDEQKARFKEIINEYSQKIDELARARKKLFEEEHVGADSVHEVQIPDGTYAIADNSWARLEEDGHVRVGIHHIFLRILGSIESIEFPAIGEQVYQGEACVRIVDEKGRSHRLWAPVTGRVATVNNEISEDLSVLFDNPYLDGWMLLFAPSYLDKDLENLQRIG